jgi:hypothetical protein
MRAGNYAQTKLQVESSKKLEAAIGIEPMNKGFAVRTGGLLCGILGCHRPIFTGFFRTSRPTSITLFYEVHTINIRYDSNARVTFRHLSASPNLIYSTGKPF